MSKLQLKKTKLGLQLPTDPRWADLAQMSLEDILTDHAYCEQKAASSCISLIQSYPLHEELVAALAPVVSEEWMHFRLVVEELKKRGLKLGLQRKDEYIAAISKFVQKGGKKEGYLLDRLLMCALIEARSCERFRLLHEQLHDRELADFYYTFMVAEASHYKLFLSLAKHYINEASVMKRWEEWLVFEAEVMHQLTPRGDRMH
jgi:tRNA-(ms[2]io[6]A)-hydroxylase